MERQAAQRQLVSKSELSWSVTSLGTETPAWGTPTRTEEKVSSSPPATPTSALAVPVTVCPSTSTDLLPCTRPPPA